MKVKEGSESAAAQTLEEEDAGGLEGLVGEVAEMELLWPCLGACRCSCSALASAFSCVRTKYAKFCQRISAILASSSRDGDSLL